LFQGLARLFVHRNADRVRVLCAGRALGRAPELDCRHRLAHEGVGNQHVSIGRCLVGMTPSLSGGRAAGF